MNSTASDPTLLIALVAVAEELSFSKAAARLGVTKGTISRKIARLEARVGASLIWRSTHAVSLTMSGTDLYERARGPVRALDEVAYEHSRTDAPLSGSIRLAVAHDVASAILPAVLAGFIASHPFVSFDLSVGTEPVSLVHARVDLALRVAVGQLPRSSYVIRKLCELPLSFFAAPSYLARRGEPRAFGEPAHTWLAFVPRGKSLSQKSVRRAYLQLDAPEDFRPHTSDDFGSLLELAVKGVGVAALPAFFAQPLVDRGALCAVLTQLRARLAGTLYLVSPPRAQTSARVSAFRAHVIDLLATRK